MTTLIRKILALLRYGLVRFTRPGISVPRVSYIGPGCTVQKMGKGSITASGKVRLDHACELLAIGKLVIGNNLVLNGYSRIIAHELIEIGDNVVIARFVSILDHDHAITKSAQDGSLSFNGYTTAPIKIGNNVWIGDKVSILKGVTIGNNVVIGANAVVTRDIPSNCIAGGIPARVLKQL